MPLKLRVISDHYKLLGPRRSQLFGVTGGRIGRAPDNDWVLPDAQHFISGHHAAIAFRAGNWLLEDTSRNGVYLNDSDVPVAQTGPVRLSDGDRLRIGEYDVLVTIDDNNDFSADVSGQMPIPPALRDPITARESRAQAAAHKSRKPRAESDVGRQPAAQQVDLDAILKPDLEVTDLLVPVRRVPGQKDRLASSASIKLHADAGTNEAVADLCRGLGVDPKALPSRSQSALLTAAGQLLREIGMQLSRTLRRQAEDAGVDFNAPATQDTDNPLFQSPSHESTMYRLFDAVSANQLNGVDVVRDAFDRIRDHDAAFDAAIATAVNELLSKIDPARLAARSDQSSGSSLFGAGKKEKYWDLFSEVYVAIDQRDERGWPTVLAREFAKALAAQIRDGRSRN